MEPPVDVSIVIPSYGARRTLDATITACLSQRTTRSFEVVVVASADDHASLPTFPADPRLVTVTHVPRLSAAAARNQGVELARGAVLAFTDDDAEPAPDWLERLLEASDGGTRCVAGGVRNGTPRSAMGTAEYLVEFVDLHPGRPSRTAWHGATVSLLVPRDLLRDAGGFPEDMGGGEDTWLTLLARRRGRFVFEGRAVVVHRNRTAWRSALRHQYEFGCFSARLARRSQLKFGFLVRHWPLAPIASAGRFVSVYARALAWLGEGRARAFLAAPLVAAELVAWGAGVGIEGARLSRRRGQTQ